jgi:hypothetical protein
MVIDLAGLLRSLVDGDVRFVVIGGVAVAAHAAVRATEDVDLVPDPDPENMRSLTTVLENLDARLLLNLERGIDAEVRSALLSGRNLTVTTSQGDLDVVQRLPGVPPFPALLAESVEVELFDVRFRVCSREHLVAMKRARGAAIDLADLERLEPS